MRKHKYMERYKSMLNKKYGKFPEELRIQKPNIYPIIEIDIIKEVVNDKDYYRRYSEVHIDIIVKNEEGLGGDACIDYFDSVLPDEMPCLIFKEGVDVKYVYYVDDE